MRRLLLLVSVAVLTTSVPVAADTFVNLGFRTHTVGIIDLTAKSLGPVWAFTPREGRGFYGQLSPSFTRTVQLEGYPELDLADAGLFGASFSVILGPGRTILLSPFGLVVGGGVAADFSALMDEYSGDFAFFFTWGAGGGVHVFLELVESSLLFDIGLNGSWRPFGILGSGDGSSGVEPVWRTYDLTLSLGVGFRRTPRPEVEDRSRTVRPSLDESIDGPRRRMTLDVVMGGGSMASARFWYFPVRDFWFIRGGLGFTAPSASPLVVNVPLSISTGLYLFPRRLRSFRLHVGLVETVNVLQYVQGGGLRRGEYRLGRTMVQNIGLTSGAEFNISTRLGILIEPAIYPISAASGISERSAFQIGLGVRILQR